jgi:hypothetical protein
VPPQQQTQQQQQQTQQQQQQQQNEPQEAWAKSGHSPLLPDAWPSPYPPTSHHQHHEHTHPHGHAGDSWDESGDRGVLLLEGGVLVARPAPAPPPLAFLGQTPGSRPPLLRAASSGSADEMLVL